MSPLTEAASITTVVDDEELDERRVEILLDLLAGALTDYWAGGRPPHPETLRRTGLRTPRR